MIGKALFAGLSGIFGSARTFDPLNPRDPALAKLFGVGQQTAAGVNVTPEKVLGLPAVKRAIEIISNGMMNKACKIVRVEESGDVLDKQHPANSILRKVNRNMLFSDWVNTMQSWACLFGNAVSAIEYTNDGQVELYPFIPTKTRLILASGKDVEQVVGSEFQLFYETYIDGKRVLRLPENVIHIQGLSSNGYWGHNLVDLLRETFAGDIAARLHGNKVFGQGATPKGFVSMPGNLKDDEAVRNFKESIEKVTSGLDNAHKIVTLEDNAKFQPWSQTNEETQFLGKLQFDLIDLANAVGIQAAKIGVRSEQSYNSLEMAEQEHQSDDMQAWETKWEDELSEKLFLPDEQETHRFKFENKTNWVPYKQKVESATKAYHGGLADQNESRKIIGLPPIQGRDSRFNLPANITPMNRVSQPQKSSGQLDMLKTAVISALLDICKRLKKVAEGKLKDSTKFVEWVDSMDVKQGAEYLHAASIPMCKLIKKELLNLLETVTSDQLEVSVVSFMEACELNFPKQFSKEVLK